MAAAAWPGPVVSVSYSADHVRLAGKRGVCLRFGGNEICVLGVGGNFTLAASCAVLCDCCYWRCTHPPDGPVPVLHPRLVARASCTAADTHGVERFGWLPLSFGGDPTELFV
jgi:hypothetical protein